MRSGVTRVGGFWFKPDSRDSVLVVFLSRDQRRIDQRHAARGVISLWIWSYRLIVMNMRWKSGSEWRTPEGHEGLWVFSSECKYNLKLSLKLFLSNWNSRNIFNCFFFKLEKQCLPQILDLTKSCLKKPFVFREDFLFPENAWCYCIGLKPTDFDHFTNKLTKYVCTFLHCYIT